MRLGSADSVVLPVPDRPKKIAVSPSGPMLAEQCIGMMPCGGSRKLSRPNTDFFISPAYAVPPIRISFFGEVDRDHRLAAAAVALGIGAEARQVDDREFGLEAGKLIGLGPHQHRADEQIVPGQLVDDAHVTRYSGCEPP